MKRLLLICSLVIGSLFVSPVVSGAKSAELTKAQALNVLSKNVEPFAAAFKKLGIQMSSVKATTSVETLVGYCNTFIKASNKFSSFLSETVWPRSLAPSFSSLTQSVSAVSSDLESFTLDPTNGSSYFLQAIKDMRAETNFVSQLAAALKR